MRSYQKTVYEGELLGEIEWSYDFYSHLACVCSSELRKMEMLFGNLERLWQVERAHKKGLLLRVRSGDYWHNLIAIGMYDGWPYWKPVPSVFLQGPLGGEWHDFTYVDEWKVRA